ncbi:unnamed protein product [Peronospora farinosa]|uniref:Uncharacterized protein n=1 Tax=Peronospora farinosa TaxID=134698 RepID=A0AAV0T8N5_9STRA|nr:unnamed protein product [Peronospora farinosa]
MTQTVMIDVKEHRDLHDHGLIESKEQEEIGKIAPTGVTHAAVAMGTRPLTETTGRDETISVMKKWTDSSKTVMSQTLGSSMAMQSPVTTQQLPTNSISTETPAKIPATTETSEQNDVVMPTIQRSDGLPGSPLNNVKTDAPATAESSTAGAVVKYPEEAPGLPFITPAVPGESAESPSVTTSAGKTDKTTTLPASNSSNNTGTVSPASGGEDTDGTNTAGQVHASTRADVPLDESSKDADTKSSDSFEFQGANTKNEASTITEDYSVQCSTNCSKGDLEDKSSSDTTRSNDDDSSGLARGMVHPGRMTDVYTRSVLSYSMDTGSIVAIVGVIAGIVGLLVLIAVISRKKDTDEDDECLHRNGYNMEIHSIVGHLPTFLENDSFMESGNNDTSLTVAAPAHQSDGVSPISDESLDEMPSLRGRMLVTDHSGDISGLDRNGGVKTGNVRISSLFSAGSSTTSDSEISCSWSSVLASDSENLSSRNTRDTSLSAWSATNVSPFENTACSALGLRGMTRTLSTDYHQTDGSNSTRFSPRLINYSNLPDENRSIAGPVESRCSVNSTEL